MRKQYNQTKRDFIRQAEQLARRQNLEIAAWNAERFEGKRSLNIVLNLRSYIINYQTRWKHKIRNEDVCKTARLFKNKINQLCFGSSYRHNKTKELILTIDHQQSIEGEKLQHHLHIQVELPNTVSENCLREFVSDFCRRTAWVLDQQPYVEITKSNTGTQFYNSRDGEHTTIIF
jgi:hypothetical protein